MDRQLRERDQELARRISREARADPHSPYAGKYVGILGGKVVVVADSPEDVLRELRKAAADRSVGLLVDTSVDYDAEHEVWQDCAVEAYRTIVRKVIDEYASFKPSHGKIETEAIVDPERDHYEVMHVGWDGPRRVHGSVIHIDIINGKVWIQYDGTTRPVAEELIAAGVPREAIVLGFHPAEVRGYTGFATGDDGAAP